MEKEMVQEVVSYKCMWCNQLHKSETDADICALNHAKENLANSLWESGRNLESVEYWCKFGWKLSEEQKLITKDNCFVMSHWQCSDKPAYQITRFDERGNPKLWGKGGWSGYYGNFIQMKDLPEAHHKEELFIDPR